MMAEWRSARLGSIASGRLLFRNVKGDLRTYQFEVTFDYKGIPEEPDITVSPDDNAFNRDTVSRAVTGLPSGQRKDLRARVLMVAKTLHEMDEAQRQWLLGEFAKGQPAPSSDPNKASAVHRGWLITRVKTLLGERVSARRL